MTPMITESADDRSLPVAFLWRITLVSAADADLRSLRHRGGGRQGEWLGSHHDVRQGSGRPDQAGVAGHWGPLHLTHRAVARELMTSVVPSQTWGITSGVPSGWTVAQKNGFAGGVANSVGFVEDPDGGGYVIVVLSNGWPTWSRGVAVVEEIAGWVSSVLAG